MQTINLTEAKAKFSAVIEQAEKGEEIIITRLGKPIAKISQYEPPKKKPLLGAFEGEVWIADDFEEWPEDVARALGIID